MGKSEQAIKKSDRSCLGCPVSDDFRGTVKSKDKDGDGEVNKYTYQFRHDDGAKEAEASPFFRPVILFCAKILADKSSKGQSKTGDRQKAEAFYFGIGPTACNCHFAEFIYIGLYDYIGKCDDRILKPGGKAVGNDLTQHRQVKAYHPY